MSHTSGGAPGMRSEQRFGALLQNACVARRQGKIGVALAGLLASGTLAQGGPVYSTDATLVMVPALVTDASGAPVSDLSPSEFRLYTERTDPDRSNLAEITKRLGRRALKDIAQVAKPDTILGWHRQPVARKFDGSRQRGYPGRPRVSRNYRNWSVWRARTEDGDTTVLWARWPIWGTTRLAIVLTAVIPYSDDPFLTDVQRDVWIHVLQVVETHLSTQGKQIIVPDGDHNDSLRVS
jgi:hypothetical protein